MKDRIKVTENLFEEFPEITAAEWKAEIAKDLNGGDIEKLDWKPYEGFTVSPFYTEGDLNGIGYLTEQIPGEFPYARGNKTESNDWKISEYITSGSVKEANRLALHSLRMGAESLTFVCEAGHSRIAGIPIQSERDMSMLLKDVPLEDVPLHFKCGLGASGILSLLIIETGRRGIDKKKLEGSVDADPLKALALGGSFPAGERRAFGEIGSMISYLNKNMPSYGALNVSGHHFHDSGASATEELAFTLAAGVEYMDRLTKMDLTADRITPHMRFSFSIGSNYFMEIAKLRAARLLWAYVIEEYGAENESSKKMRIDTRTSSWNKTVFDPYVNMLRGTVEAMAAAIGGSESLNVLPLDATFKRPDEFSLRMARNTQLILKHESCLDRVTDPSGGSYYIERLTDSLAEAAWELFKKVEGTGGLAVALKTGFVQDEILKTRNERDSDTASGKSILLGTNRYPNPGEKAPKKIDRGISEKPLRRSGETAHKANAGSRDFMEELIAYMTRKKSLLGDVLPDKPVKPEFAIAPLRPYRGGEPFEELRLATLKYKKETGSAPAVFLLPVGNQSMRNARASFTANFFGCAGFRILENPGFDSIDDGVRAALKSRAKIVVICSSDRESPELAPGICGMLRAKDPDIRILIAGNPGEHIEALKASGIDDFIHDRSNALRILRKYQEISGIRQKGEEN
ncbi:MAG: acyl-CoA mutase large subunit family protein [Candidatus Dadabacteria bacterium]|nr:acyl-CoA mutase large subunit family protein [Candidatus Dadabacteria bacterium]